MRVESRNRRVPRAPLPVAGVTRSRGDLQGRLRGHYSSFLASYGLMRQTKSLPAPRWSLVRRVLAGCRQSLLGDGPSRHYLCNPCVGAWTHTPPRLSSALAHSFLESTGLTPRKMRSAREIVPAMQRQQGAVFRGCSHSFIFRLLRSLGPQIASTAASSCWAAGPFTPRIARVVTHSGMWHRYVSRLGQLTRLDLHQLDCSLVGCSLPHPAPRRMASLRARDRVDGRHSRERVSREEAEEPLPRHRSLLRPTVEPLLPDVDDVKAARRQARGVPRNP